MTAPAAGIGCIVLAAGSSKRFGADKRAARLNDGTTLLEHTLRRIPATFTRRILVLHPGDEHLAACFQNEWHIIFAAEAHKGMGHSLAAAMPLASDWLGAVIGLADMPCVLPATYTAIQQRLTSGSIVVPYYRQLRGNPTGIGSNYFPQLAALQGDQGARILLQRHAAAVVRLDLDDPGILQDIDTREALLDLPGNS